MFSASNDIGGEAITNANHSSVIIISEDEEDSVVYVGTSNADDKKEENETGEKSNASGYFAESSSSASSSFSFGTPPDRTEYLRLLYSGQGALIPDESLRPPPRENKFKTSTPQKKNDA